MEEQREQIDSSGNNNRESTNSSSNTLQELSFSDLINSADLVEKLSKHGFVNPTAVQRQTIKEAIEGRDLVIQAKTGSGKTLAFVLPLLIQLKEGSRESQTGRPLAMIIVPTRELAQQITEVISSLTDSSIEPACIIGGVNTDSQRQALSKDSRIIVGTPGRLLDLLRQRMLNLLQCRYFVLDEADEMLSMGFFEDVRAILSRLPDKRQGLFVGATISARVDMLAHSFLDKPLAIAVDSPTSDLPPIQHFYYEVGSDLMAKPSALCDLLETVLPRNAIVFCNTKSDTKLLEALLRRRGFDARRINSDLTQSQRDKVMKKIRSGELKYLIATDIAARGIDIEQIELVVNYSIHEQPEIYIHRTGRTGRAGKTGRAISLVGPRDFGSFHFLTKVLDVDFRKIPPPSNGEVADARLLHLYELLRDSKVVPCERDILVARKLLEEVGGISESSEELEIVVAKLCRHIAEHAIQAEAASLDEEFMEPPARIDEEQSDSRRSSSRSSGDRGTRREERNGDRRERRDRNRREERKGKRRDNRERRERIDGERERRHGNVDNREGNNRGPRVEAGRSSNPPREQREPEPRRIRLFISQGLQQGMTSDLFSELAGELADLQKADILRLQIRDRYGFVDLLESQAEKLVDNLNGIEYNNQPLSIEFASVVYTERHDQEERRGRGRRPRHDDRDSRHRRG